MLAQTSRTLPRTQTRGAAPSCAPDRCNTAADGCRLELGAAEGTKATDAKGKRARKCALMPGLITQSDTPQQRRTDALQCNTG